MAERRVPTVLLGLGSVGRTLLRQILDARKMLSGRQGLWLDLVGLVDSQALLLGWSGLPEEVLRDVLQIKAQGGSLRAVAGSRPSPGRRQGAGWAEDLDALLEPEAIFVDVTASTETGSLLRTVAQAGCGLVLANKHPLAGPWPEAKKLFAYRDLRYEATVGAGLPVNATLGALLDAGDKVTAIEGCMSGTLGYVCTQLEDGVTYSTAVSQAHALGYTEPDPREDLSGRDVARKGLILARSAGWPLEMADLTVEPMYPETLSDVTRETFMARMAELDEPYARRVEAAAIEGCVLRYVARVGPQGGTVGLTSVEREGVLGALRGPANYFSFSTARYAREPLIIAGPGAGPGVTAAGVLADLVDLALQRHS